MRFLLVAISIIFSFIFFLFYTASLWKSIFLNPSDNFFFWKSIFWDIWITPVIFLIITILLFFYFKSTVLKNFNKEEKENNINFFLYIFSTISTYLIIVIIFFILNIDYYWIVFAFSLGIWIYFISKYLFYNHKISKKIYILSNIFSIISWYIASFIGILYINFIEQELLFLLSLVWIWFFHIYTHVKYNNIISLLFWVITFIFSLYRLIVHLFPWII
jgi:hypothetical protein